MNEEDYACDKFRAQRWRKDVCRNCYQPLRLHEKKRSRTEPGSKPTERPPTPPSSSLPSPRSTASSSQKQALSFSTSRSKTAPHTTKGKVEEKRQEEQLVKGERLSTCHLLYRNLKNLLGVPPSARAAAPQLTTRAASRPRSLRLLLVRSL